MIVFYRQFNIHVKRAMVSVMVLPLIMGCIPYAAHYFDTSGLGVVPGSGSCDNRVGLPTYGVVVLGNHRVVMSVDRDWYWGSRQKSRKEPYVVLRIAFGLKGGQSVSFDPVNMQLTDKLGNQLKMIGNPYVLIEQAPSRPDRVPIEVTTKSSYTNTETSPLIYLPIVFYWEFEVTKDMKEFISKPSSATLSGVDYMLPEVIFVEKFGATIVPLNC